MLELEVIKYKRPTYLGDQGNPVTQEAFDVFVEKHGIEKATIYLQAINDFTNQLEVILGGGYCRNGIGNSGHVVRKNVISLRDHNREFLKTNSNIYDIK